MVMRKSYTAQEKAKIVLDALKGNLTQNEITAKYGVHGTQIANWKKQLKEGLEELFSDRRKRVTLDQEKTIEELQRKIGQLTMELDWLKKKLTCSAEEKAKWIETESAEISIRCTSSDSI